ncbi:nitrile hydratase subunit beta [Pseudoroseicyclus sp. H15]
MDTVHDLGGVQGFGPVDVAAPPFAHDWEQRVWAISRFSRGGGDWTIDWWRHIIERMPPDAYLTQPYFVKWALADMVGYICSGTFTLDEVLSGHPEEPREPPAAIDREGARALQSGAARSFERPAEAPPRFEAGDAVRTILHPGTNHTRLPRYARGHTGEVIAHRGAHVFADANAEGRSEAQHLYTIAFQATELWGPEADARDSVTLDLWESHLEPG